VTYKTIVVHMDLGKQRRHRLALAFALAERWGAHLIGVFGVDELTPPAGPEGRQSLIAHVAKLRREAAEAAEEEFSAEARKRQYTARSEWRASLDDGFAVLKSHAMCADLAVVGQPDPESEAAPPWFAHELVMSIGRPVLYVPLAWRFDDCGTRTLVAWNASREAARAVRDAVPFLQAAKGTEVVTFDAAGVFREADAPTETNVGPYLVRHGIEAALARQPTNGGDVGAAIVSRAAANRADLVVMGAYGHSRLREVVLGGATRTVFESMTVPTLMSH